MKKDTQNEEIQGQSQTATDQPQSDESTQLREELTKMTELAQRTMADLQNLKRRHEEERSALYFSANSNLIKSLLPALDNLQRALEHTPESAKNDETLNKWTQGLEMAINQFKQIFELSGLEEISALNQKFDPALHEALIQGPGTADLVIEVLEKGYKLGDLVIRHAKVKVGNGE